MRGQLEQAKGRYDELLADYRKAVIQAFTDVENALTAWRFTTEQEALARDAVAVAQRAADIARAQMAAGTVDITTVLTAETTLFNDQDALAQVRLARFQALLSLYKALGGGWTQPPGPIVDQFPGLQPGSPAGWRRTPRWRQCPMTYWHLQPDRAQCPKGLHGLIDARTADRSW